MIKRTLSIGSPARLYLRNAQLMMSKKDEGGEIIEKSLPIEDLGVVILEDPQITISLGLIAALLENNVALISCDGKHLPTGMMLNLCGNTTQAESFRQQAEASQPLKKQLWQQVIIAKIHNQAQVLKSMGGDAGYLLKLREMVKSGDSDNREAVASAHYWPRLFAAYPGFQRERDAGYPNNLLNYGYAILRAIIARSLAGSGLMPTLGIFHHNRYNNYCLADDMMEPYRPYVDLLVARMVDNTVESIDILDTETKKNLLSIPVINVCINKKTRPLMVAASETSASLAKCFSGLQKRVSLPRM
ncbi:MAG: type II CRISPR-associated endonuclease Cas1 [Lentimicrobiaceae bacterium]|nr:type II CRISPR-associated endonuclease Cas1 [Lentimicrobiaceae bacterium]